MFVFPLWFSSATVNRKGKHLHFIKPSAARSVCFRCTNSAFCRVQMWESWRRKFKCGNEYFTLSYHGLGSFPISCTLFCSLLAPLFTITMDCLLLWWELATEAPQDVFTNIFCWDSGSNRCSVVSVLHLTLIRVHGAIETKVLTRPQHLVLANSFVISRNIVRGKWISGNGEIIILKRITQREILCRFNVNTEHYQPAQ